jgi:uncharacterized delta-60 repeat protein
MGGWCYALLLAVALWSLPLRAQTQLDPSFGPLRVYQPSTVTQALVLSTGDRLVLTNNILRANGMDLTQRLARFSAAGVLDVGFAQVTASYSWSPQGLVDGGNGRVLVTLSGSSTLNGQLHYGLVRLLPSGDVDATFSAQPSTLSISSLLVQPDGKIVVAGTFASYFGQPVGNLVRLNADGTQDFTFTFNSAGGLDMQSFRPVLALQPDGKIVVGGSFRQAGGLPRSALARFNTDGTLDAGFVPPTTATAVVGAVAVQPDGRILASTVNNLPLVAGVTQQLVRFTAGGALDNSFTPPAVGVRAAYSGGGTTLLVQPDGKILFAFSSGLVPPGYLMRLTSSGAIDPTWSIPILPANSAPVTSVQLLPAGQVVFGGSPQLLPLTSSVPTGAAQLTATGAVDTTVPIPVLQTVGHVRNMALQPDGKLLLAGTFTEINGTAARGMARLNANGSVDTAYTAACQVKGGYPTNVVLQPDGKALVAGRFTSLGGIAAPSLGRVLPSGLPDPAFTPALYASATVNVNTITAMDVQANGQVLLAGAMQLSSGSAFQRFLRLLPDGSYDSSFQPPSGLIPSAVLAEPTGNIVVGNSDPLMPAVQRLLPTGAVDPSFGSTAVPLGGFSISGLRRYADGRLLAFGSFSTFGSVTTASIARLSSTGVVDPTFSASNITTVTAAAMQPNGRVLLAGIFSRPGTVSQYLARVLPNGATDFSLDASLNPNGIVYALAVQPNGALVVAGQFHQLGGQFHYAVARLLDANVLHVAAPELAARTEVWPVPAHDKLYLRLDAGARPERVVLRDALGREVLSQAVVGHASEASLPIENIPAGVYLLQVHYASGTVTKRIATTR